MRHIPVLLAEVREALAPESRKTFIDGTFGAGGYTRALLAAAADTQVLAIDRDPAAVLQGAGMARESRGRLRIVNGTFGALDALAAAAGWNRVDGVVLDIGVSSMQIDDPRRGFSLRSDGPLDMRMGADGPSAADLVNDAPEEELADILFHFGEERRARAVARAIVERRRRGAIETTGELAALVAAHVRGEPGGQHPATRSFQALRIAVNDELGQLVLALHAAERVLAPGGRLAVVTFHSLEDRLVKQFMAARAGRVPSASRHEPARATEAPSFAPVTRGPVTPAAAELAANPRSRSAKLRACERTDAAPQEPLAALATLAGLPARTTRRAAAR